jgi:hypothetical protein
MHKTKVQRVAWLLHNMGTDRFSFHHILSKFTKIFSDIVTFTEQGPSNAPGFENAFVVREVRATRYIKFSKTENGYKVDFSYACRSGKV